MENQKYYFICCTVSAYMCSPIIRNIVISESLQDFLYINTKYDRKHQTFVCTFYSEIDKEMYTTLKELNPTKEGYFILKKYDLAK